MLREWGPTECLSSKQLRTRALTLLRIDLVARSADIGRIRRGLVRGRKNPVIMSDGRMGVRFLRPKGLSSTWEWADGEYSVMFFISSYPADERICTVSNVTEYLRKKIGATGPLFVGLNKSMKPIKASTLSSIVRDQVLGTQGASINACSKKATPKGAHFFDPDSLRGASATGALLGGSKRETIRSQARWADIKTFNRHYNRALQIATQSERKRMERIAGIGQGWPLHLALRRSVGARYGL